MAAKLKQRSVDNGEGFGLLHRRGLTYPLDRRRSGRWDLQNPNTPEMQAVALAGEASDRARPEPLVKVSRVAPYDHC
jgi:hypothetical protein